MNTHWQELLANFAVVVLFVSAWTQACGWVENRAPGSRSIMVGLMMGAGSAVLMQIPVELTPGRIVDLRSTLIAVSGFFGGPLSGLITAVIASAARIASGGSGVWPGIVGITVTTVIGISGNRLLRGRQPRPADLILLSAATVVGALSGFFVSGSSQWKESLPEIGVQLSVMVMISTLVVSFMIHQDASRRLVTRANHTYRAIIEALPDSLNAKDREGRFLAANPATAKLMRAENASDLIGKTDFAFYPAKTADTFRADEIAVLAAGSSRIFEQEITRLDGEKVWLSTLKTPLLDESGAIVGLITHNRDVTNQKRLEVDLAETQSRLSIALTHMADALVMFDPNGRLIFSNAQYDALFSDMSEVRAPGVNVREILRASADRGEETGIPAAKIETWLETFRSGAQVDTDREIRIADGRWLHVRTRSTLDGGILAVLSDISARKVAEQALSELNARLEVLAMTDGLTGLLNRRAFDQTLRDEYARCQRNDEPLSLLMIDVDMFKAFNDSYGHPAGDRCLRSISECLVKTLKRAVDKSARYGGEELAVILPATSFEGAWHVAETLRLAVHALAIPHSHSKSKIVTISIGVSSVKPATEQIGVQELVGRADEALYDAKAAGRDCVRRWRPTSGRDAAREVARVSDRRHAG
ncbi:MAG: diguanylate cyclase [Mesorhizobium sp.]|nr:diguanylate cyclase [Mesorhizobium sp.]